MRISDEEGRKKFKEMKEKCEEKRENQVKALKISKVDKDIKEEIKKLFRDKEVVLKTIEWDAKGNRETDMKWVMSSLDRIDSQIQYYVGLGQIRKQSRTNINLLIFTIGVFLLMLIQIYIAIKGC